MNTRRASILSLMVSILLAAGTSATFAADPPSTAAPAPSKEMRAKMATAHEQMATCLRSDKPFSDCRAQMMKSCHETMGQKDCPMMGMGMGMDMHDQKKTHQH